MKLPTEVENLCVQYLAQVRQDPEHKLELWERINFYKSFQPASFNFPDYKKTGERINNEEYDQFLINHFKNMNEGDHAISWLGIITVQHVLADWELVENLDKWETKYLDRVKEILQDCQAMLLGELDFNETHEKLVSDYWYFTHYFVHYDLACLEEAAIYALAVIIYGGKEYEVTGRAEQAYTVIDHNLPGEADQPEPPIPLEYDTTKRLEFWEWWLTEAIPQAWEIANKTS